MTLIKEFFAAFKTLTFVDCLFFAAVVVLMILIVALIYFIKINKDEEIIVINDPNENLPISLDEVENVPISLQDIGQENETEEPIDLESVAKALEERTINPIEMTEYEQEQEEKAIISYDELLSKSNSSVINYEIKEEEEPEDISIKKVNLGNLVNTIEEPKPPKVEVRVISYDKEEAFLEALKKLSEQIN